MKKNYRELEVEYVTEKLSFESKNRRVYWIIKPSQLSPLRRLFNPLHKLRFYYYDGDSTDLFSADEYFKVVDTYKTVGDLMDRKAKYEKIINDIWTKKD